MSSYTEIIRTGIFLKRPFRALINLLYILRSGPKTGKPFMLKFESSTICNLKCKMCPLTKGLSRKRGVLKFENFKKIFDEINPPYLNLTGIGEPLLNPEIFKIIEYARKKNSLVKIDTNATLLNLENIKKLLKSKPSFVSISIDGITKKSYESIRVGGKFEEIIKNLRRLIEYRNKIQSETKIHLFFVLQQNNIYDLLEIIKFGDKLGIDSVNGTIVTPLGNNKNKENLKISKMNIPEVKEELKSLRKKIKINLNIESIIDFLNNPERVDHHNDSCFWPWYQSSITWDGYVVPCCIFCNNEIVFGNVFKESFMKVWNNNQAQNFRKQIIKERKGICASCNVNEKFIRDKKKIIEKIPLINKLFIL